MPFRTGHDACTVRATSRIRRPTLGVRGVGEGGTLGPYAVIAGAVADALGVGITTLPVTPTAVWTEMS